MSDVEMTAYGYQARIGKIARTRLGVHDHYGIFTAEIHLDLGDAGNALRVEPRDNRTFGGYTLDDRPADDGHRPGTDAGMDWIIRVCRVFPGCSWETLIGRTCLVLSSPDASRPRSPLGLAPLPTERGVPFLLADWEARWIEPEDRTLYVSIAAGLVEARAVS